MIDNEGKNLFHYCSVSSCLNIIENSTIRLSPLSYTNDFLEGRYFYEIFHEALKCSDIDEGIANVARVLAKTYPEHTEGFAFCLSEEGDLLSQWRAYADNGAGFSIGFDKEILEGIYEDCNFGKKFTELKRVKYEADAVKLLIDPIVESLSAICREYKGTIFLSKNYDVESAAQGILSSPGRDLEVFEATNHKGHSALNAILQALSPLQFEMYQFKIETFREEKEWRLLRYRHKAHFAEINYSAHATGIRPFINSKMKTRAKAAINKIILGPRNSTNIEWMTAFLSAYGFGHVTVQISQARGYR